jgi:uncharacterized membrane protein
MNKFWKWFLIIVAVLLVLCGLLAAVLFLTHGSYGYPFMRYGMGFRRMPMMGSFGFFGFGMMAVRLIVPLLLVSLLVLIGVGIGSRNRNSQPKVTQPEAPASTLTQEPGAPAPAEAVSEKVCAHCGRPLQAEWVNCPYCGAKI